MKHVFYSVRLFFFAFLFSSLLSAHRISRVTRISPVPLVFPPCHSYLPALLPRSLSRPSWSTIPVFPLASSRYLLLFVFQVGCRIIVGNGNYFFWVIWMQAEIRGGKWDRLRYKLADLRYSRHTCQNVHI
ncbi:hypothetical protein RSAG8_01168, partial [Rhizoctonia solani AG-8 WAC10335]